MARALRAWAINRGGKNSVRNLRYGPRTRLVRGLEVYINCLIAFFDGLDVVDISVSFKRSDDKKAGKM